MGNGESLCIFKEKDNKATSNRLFKLTPHFSDIVPMSRDVKPAAYRDRRWQTIKGSFQCQNGERKKCQVTIRRLCGAESGHGRVVRREETD